MTAVATQLTEHGGVAPDAPASGTAFESVARTAAPPSAIFSTPRGAQNLAVVLDVTANTGGNTATLTISGVDRSGNKLWTILASAAKTVSTTVLRVSPNITASANLIAQDVVPSEIQIDVAHSDGAAITYSVGVHFAA
jgi:hypothetical protein